MKSTREKWFGKKYDFYLIGHEHLYVFRKPEAGEKVTRESMKWWYVGYADKCSIFDKSRVGAQRCAAVWGILAPRK